MPIGPVDIWIRVVALAGMPVDNHIDVFIDCRLDDGIDQVNVVPLPGRVIVIIRLCVWPIPWIEWEHRCFYDLDMPLRDQVPNSRRRIWKRSTLGRRKADRLT